jgi:ArsR family transcriptional regulator
MKSTDVIDALAALAQASRLEIFRALVVAGHEGLTPGVMSDRLGVAANTLSFHLKELMQANLVCQQRMGRHLIYRAEFQHMNEVLAYLTQNCCQGQPCVSSPNIACQV